MYHLEVIMGSFKNMFYYSGKACLLEVKPMNALSTFIVHWTIKRPKPLMNKTAKSGLFH